MDHALTTSEAWKIVAQWLKEQHPEVLSAVTRAVVDADTRARTAPRSGADMAEPQPARIVPHSHAWIRTEVAGGQNTLSSSCPVLDDRVYFRERPFVVEGVIVGCTKSTNTVLEYEVVFFDVSPPPGALIHFDKEYTGVMPTAYVIPYASHTTIDPSVVMAREEQAQKLASIRDEMIKIRREVSRPYHLVRSVDSTDEMKP